MDKFQELTEILRSKRNFNPNLYIKLKINLINDFFRDNKLDSVIIGVSGGIDSAVVLSLLSLASEEKNSPIKKIIALTLPIYSHGTSGQADSVNRAHLLFKSIKNEKVVSQIVDLTDVAAEYTKSAKKSNDKIAAWSIGQMCSMVRTPFLYFQAAILQEAGYKSIVCGTINRDEGSYIGFYGKASDAMVDLQIIADIHKSEVYQIATLLHDIPPEIIVAQPKGDVWDGKIDIEMIGATYDFLEIYTLFMSENSNMTKEFFDKSFLEFCSHPKYVKMKENVDKLHEINKHKYEVGMPSHFIDIMKRKI
jgi:NAD+ synthase (glutamine-hydrolysing)